MFSIFSNYTLLTKVNGENFYTHTIFNKSYMFFNYYSLKTLNLSKFKTDNVYNMSVIFYIHLSIFQFKNK